MTYASILVHVQAGDEGQPRLDCAAALCGTFDATLIGLGAEMIPLPESSYGLFVIQDSWFKVVRDSIEANLEGARKAFDAAAVDLKKPTVWKCGIQLPTAALVQASRAADLIVASTPPERREDSFRDASPAELIITSARPVLIVPSKGPKLAGERIVFAWKDTREARRAMADAMPFFERSKGVLVLEICPKGDLRDAKLRTRDVVDALHRHGVSATSKVVHGPVEGRRIVHEASDFGADLIVAGGYGHSRLGEWVYGGVTRDLLAQDERHVLLSH